MSITWRELERRLADVTEDQMDTDVTVLLMETDEVHQVDDFVPHWDASSLLRGRKAYGIDQVEGVLDGNHPYFTVLA